MKSTAAQCIYCGGPVPDSDAYHDVCRARYTPNAVGWVLPPRCIYCQAPVPGDRAYHDRCRDAYSAAVGHRAHTAAAAASPRSRPVRQLLSRVVAAIGLWLAPCWAPLAPAVIWTAIATWLGSPRQIAFA